MSIETKEKAFVKSAFGQFFAPAVLSSLGLAVGGIADCFFVGSQVGEAGLAAIGFGTPVYLFYSLISIGASIGGSIHYSQALALGEHEKATEIFGSVLRFLMVSNIAAALLGRLFLPVLLGLLGAGPGDAVTADYVRTQLAFAPLMFLQAPFYYFVHHDNNPKLAAAALISANAADVLCNYIFVVRLGMGVRGSVYSTAIGAAITICTCMYHIAAKKGNLRFRGAFRLSAVWESMGTGLATSVQYIFQFVTILVINNLLMRSGGTTGVAVFDVVYNVSLLLTAVAEGTGMAVQPMVSTYLGEMGRENIKETLALSIKWGLALSMAFTAVIFAAAPGLTSLFGLSGDGFLEGPAALRAYLLSAPIGFINALFAEYYQAVEKERMSFVIFTLRTLALLLLGAALFHPLGLGRFFYMYLFAETGTLAVWCLMNLRGGTFLRLPRIDGARIQRVFIDGSDADLGGIVADLDRFYESHDSSFNQTYYMSLAVEEVCGMIMREAMSGGGVYIELTVVSGEDGSFTLHIRDNARDFNPFAADTEHLDFEGSEEDMDLIGMKIVKAKAKSFFYRRYVGFNTLVIKI